MASPLQRGVLRLNAAAAPGGVSHCASGWDLLLGAACLDSAAWLLGAWILRWIGLALKKHCIGL